MILNEDRNNPIGLETPAAPNVATTDSKFPLNDVFQQTDLPSLGRSIFVTVKPNGPFAGIFSLTDSHHTDDNEGNFDDSHPRLILKRSNLECFPSKPISTELTVEAVKDLEAMYGRETAYKYITKMLRGLCNNYENDKTIEFLEKNAVETDELGISDNLNSETMMFEITQRVQELSLKMNSLTKRTFSSYAVIPYKYVASIMTSYAYTTGKNSTNADELVVADFALMKYYVNPDSTSDTVYVGLRSPDDPFCSSGFFGDYGSQLQTIKDPDTGNDIITIYNRFGLAMNPLHCEHNPMLYKFKITYSPRNGISELTNPEIDAVTK